MDLNDYWQENKRFVTTVAIGLVVFLVGRQVLAGKLETGISDAERRIRSSETERSQLVYTSSDLADARSENEALKSAVASLSGAVRFVPRPEFRLQPDAGSASNQYLRVLSRLREELLLLANRGDLDLDESLGMPKLSPTRAEEIERHLEALDAIDQLVRVALDARIDRIERIQLRLDPGFGSRQGLGLVERTRIEVQLRGDSRSILSVLTATQRGLDGRVLPVDTVELVPSRAKEEEIRLDLTLVLPRIADDAVTEAADDQTS